MTISSVYDSHFVAAKAIDGNPKMLLDRDLSILIVLLQGSLFILGFELTCKRNILCHMLELSFILVEVKICVLMLEQLNK